METLSKMSYFKLGQYHLALLKSPQEEAYEHLFKGLLSYAPNHSSTTYFAMAPAAQA